MPGTNIWPDPPDPNEELRVLIVEDNVIALKSYMNHMRGLGASVRGVTSKREALDTAEQWQPNIVIIDVRLNGGPVGVGLGEAIREHSPKTKIGLMTGWATSRDKRRAAETRVGGGLTFKPIGRNTFEVAVQRVKHGQSPFPQIDEIECPQNDFTSEWMWG